MTQGYGLWDQWYGLTPAEQAAQRAHEQANPNYLAPPSILSVNQAGSVTSPTATKDPSLDPNYRFTREGGFAGANAWTIDDQGNVVRPTSQTGATQNFGNYSGPFHDLRNMGQSTASTTDNAFSDWTVGELDSPGAERAAYYSSFAGKGFGEGSPAKRRFFESGFDQIYSDYLGKLGQQIRGSKEGISTEPLKWTDYLRDDPFTERYSNLTPSERGESTARYNPRARHIYY